MIWQCKWAARSTLFRGGGHGVTFKHVLSSIASRFPLSHCAKTEKKISLLQLNTNWFFGFKGGTPSKSGAVKGIMRLIPCSANKNAWHLNLASSRMSKWLRCAHMLKHQAKPETAEEQGCDRLNVIQRTGVTPLCDSICFPIYAPG